MNVVLLDGWSCVAIRRKWQCKTLIRLQNKNKTFCQPFDFCHYEIVFTLESQFSFVSMAEHKFQMRAACLSNEIRVGKKKNVWQDFNLSKELCHMSQNKGGILSMQDGK